MNLVIGKGEVEVVSINPAENSIHLIIKMPQPPEGPLSDSATKVIAQEKVQFACRYLNREGFLDGGNGHEWHIRTQLIRKT